MFSVKRAVQIFVFQIVFLANVFPKTTTVTLAPIVAAVNKAQEHVGLAGKDYGVINQNQKRFQEFRSLDMAAFFNDMELRSWADRDANRLNEILKQEGFAIRLNPFGRGGFGVVSILKVAVKWLESSHAKKVDILSNGQIYPAVKMKSGFKVCKSGKHRNLVLVVETDSQDVFYMTVADKSVLSDFALLDHIKEIESDLVEISDYSSAIFPMVNLDQEVDIGWLLDMGIGSHYVITQAMQQTKLKMNEFGAKVESAVAIGVNRCIQRDNFIKIDKPFYLWIKRGDLPFPIIAGYLDVDCWSNPGELA